MIRILGSSQGNDKFEERKKERKKERKTRKKERKKETKVERIVLFVDAHYALKIHALRAYKISNEVL